jgi:Protein of unknown function (DUF3179)
VITPLPVISVFALAAALCAQLGPGDWKTDLSRHSIPLSELKPGGPPKDGILAVRQPQFEDPGKASAWLGPKDPVLVVEMSGESRAYPLSILIWHELVIDQIGDTPILVSYCPLCNSAVVFDRRVDGAVYDFGVSGMLRNSDMVMYDRQTDSLWQQMTGEAIVGTLTGKKLQTLASQTVSFYTFTHTDPTGKVLSRTTGFDRPYGQNPYVGYEFGSRLMAPVNVPASARGRLLERIVAVEIGGTARAYSFRLLRAGGVVEDRIRQKRFVIFYEGGMVTPLDSKRISDSREVGSAAVFAPFVDGRELTFRRKNGRIIDKQTGSIWNVLGVAMEGPLAGKRLPSVDHTVAFAFAWLAFRPDTLVVGEAPPPITDQ